MCLCWSEAKNFMGELLLLYFTELVFSDNDGDGDGGGGERENGFYLISNVICYLKKKKFSIKVRNFLWK